MVLVREANARRNDVEGGNIWETSCLLVQAPGCSFPPPSPVRNNFRRDFLFGFPSPATQRYQFSMPLGPCQFVALSPLGCASQPIAVLKLSGLHYVGRRPGIITYGPQLSGPFSSLSYLEDGGTWCAGLLAEKG